MLVCQLTSAWSIQWMNNYGAEALIIAFNAHGCMYKFPAMVTADAGSQLKATARQISEVSGDDANDGTIDTTGWVNMLSTVKRRYRATKWRIAPTEAKKFNGLTEANVKVLKQLLNSQLRIFKANSVVFKSLIEMQALFTKMVGILNSRPIFYDEDHIVCVKDLICPSFQATSNDEESIKDLVNASDTNFEDFMKLFKEKVIAGNFQKFGRKATREIPDLRSGDFCFIFFPSKNNYKYGIVVKKITDHRVEMHLLVKRNASGTGQVGNQIFSTKNVTVLYRETVKQE